MLLVRAQTRVRRLAPFILAFVCWTSVAHAQEMRPAAPQSPRAGAGGLLAAATVPAMAQRKPPPPFWSPRRIVFLAGLGAALTAGAIGWQRDRELQRRRRAIEAIPAGSPDEFQRQLEDAHLLVKARNFWFTAAFGIGGAAVCYVVTTSPDIRPVPGNFTWVVQLNPTAHAITVTRAF